MNSQIKKILILRFGAIGDVVHSSELFRSIKRKHAYCEIHYVCFKTPALNIEHDPDLEKVWILESKDYKHLYSLAKKLKKEKFDLFLNLQPSIRTKFFGIVLGAKKTILYNKDFGLHAVENFWKTGQKAFGGLELSESLKLYIKEDTKNKIEGMLNKKTPVVAFNMGVSSTRQGRRWPLSHWETLARLVLDNTHAQIVLTGSKEDRVFTDPMLKISDRIRSFCGEVNIFENTVLLSLCDVVVSGDTGPLHIASAVSPFSIGLYGAAPVSRTGPYGKNSIALQANMACVPCNRRKCKFLKRGELYTPCLINISPEMVFNEIKKHI